jgi:hypothetical protein
MAYKFQRGAATLSGSIKAEDGLDANSAGFAGAGAIAGASSIDGTGDLTMGTITMSGFTVDADGDMTCKSIVIPDDATIGAVGDTDMITLDAGADVTFANDLNVVVSKAGGLNLADGAVTSTAAELNLLDGAVSANNSNGVRAAILDASNNLTIAGNLTVSGTTTTVDTTNLLVKDKLITINDGGSAASAGGAGIEFEEDGSATGFIKTSSDRAEFELQAPANNNTLTIDMDAAGEIEFGAAKKLTVAGNFNIDADISSTAAEINLVDGSSAGTIVNSKAVIYGSSGEVNATTLQIGGTSINATAAEINLIDGGTARTTNIPADGDGFLHNNNGTMEMTTVDKMAEYVFSKVTGGDATIASNGSLTLAADSVESAMINDNAISGQVELASSSDLDDADDLMIHDSNATANARIKRVGLDTLKTFFQTGVTADTAGGFSYSTFDVTSSAIANAAGSPGFFVASGSNAASPLSASVSTTLHLSGGNALGDNEWANGMIVYLKAPSNASSFNLTIVASGSERIDGEQQIVLESDNAAVTLLRCHNSRWSIV